MMGMGPCEPGASLPGDDGQADSPLADDDDLTDDDPTADDDPADGQSTADDALMERLRRIAAIADPVPESVMAAARAAFGLRDLDARIAELVRDSEVDAPLTAVRGTGTRMLSYEAGGTTIECEVATRAGQRDVSGQLSGAAAAAVEAQVPGVPPVNVPVGAHGWFTVRGLPSGPFRLRCRMSDGATIVTTWTSV